MVKLHPGFGLFTENVFLQGAITAQTGSFTGIVWIETDSLNKIALGRNVKNSLDGIYLNDNNFWYTTGDFRVGDTSNNYFYISGSTIDINADTFDLSTSTVLLRSAQNSGMLSLGATPNLDVSGSNSGIYMDGTGDFLAYGDAKNFFKKDGTSLTINAATFGLGTPTMVVSSSANSGTIRLGTNGGPLTATAATQGIYMDGTGAFQVYGDSTNYLRIDGGTVDILTDEITIQTGGTNKLKIFADGTNTPSIAMGRTLPTAYNSGDGFFADGIGTFLVGSGSGERISFDGSNLVMSASTFLMGTSGSAPYTGAYVSGSNGNIEISSSNFFLKQDGSINAGAGDFTIDTSGNVVMAGTITATAGTIGGFHIDSDDLWGGNSSISHANTKIVLGDISDGGIPKIALGGTADDLSMTVGTGFYADGDGKFKAGTANGYGIFWDASTLRVSSSEFYLGDATNYISGSGGAISVAADTFDLSTTNLRVSSSYGGTIAMGKTIPTSISGSGIFLSGSGDFLAGNHTGNKIQFAPGPGAIVMKSNTFSLDATTIVIDSSANDGKIALGATPPSAYNSGKGLYLDGTGKFLAGKAAGERIQYDGSDTLIMSSSTFLMGTSGSAPHTGAYISGSNGNLSISSSNFFLAPAGDVTMQGKITAR